MILGTVESIDSTNGISIKVDGEDAATEKKYCYLSSYIPAVNDRVIIEEIGGSYVVLGKIVTDATAAGNVNYATKAGTAGSCTGNAATATSAKACTGNAATATSAGTCTGNSKTATTAEYIVNEKDNSSPIRFGFLYGSKLLYVLCNNQWTQIN